MARVLIASAAYGGENVGDDAILAAIVEQLRSIDSQIRITAVTRRAREMKERFGIETLELMGLTNRLKTYAAIARHDLLIIGGGALIAEYTRGWKGVVAGHPGYPMTMLAVAKLLGKGTMVYAVGVESIRSPQQRFFVRLIFDRADLITLRDEDSRIRLTQDLGIRRARVVTTADPVLGLVLPPEPEAEDRPDSSSASGTSNASDADSEARPIVVINFAYGVDRRDALLDFMARTADYVIHQLGAKVLFVPMNMSEHADRRGMQLVLERMQESRHASIKQPPFDYRDVLDIVRHATLVISSRMHLLILAAIVFVPILGISRVPKIDAFLAHYGLEAGTNTKDLDFEDFRQKLDEAWAGRDAIRRRLEAEREPLAQRARSNATLLREILTPKS